MCLDIYELDPAKLLSAPGLAWLAALTKTKVKIGLLIDIDMILMVKEDIRGGICHSIYQYAIANSKKMRDYAKNKELLYLQYWDGNNLCGWAMSRKLPVNNLNLIDDVSQFNENFRKSDKKESDGGYFLEVDDHYLEKLHESHDDLLKRMKMICLRGFA